jgi:hypothetical protein
VTVSKEGHAASDARVDTGVFKCLSDGVDRDRVAHFLCPEHLDLADSKTAVLVSCHKSLERCLLSWTEDLGLPGRFTGLIVPLASSRRSASPTVVFPQPILSAMAFNVSPCCRA